ncbi:hypothetical protein [Tenacibaculum phage Larrie]|nr:hypothetical protein [Tenacibaculum phage Larrie]
MENFMEMPTPCQKCGEFFDLNSGASSYKWFPDTVICSECGAKEDEEITEDEYWDTANIEISNALYGINEKSDPWSKLDESNRKVITKLFESRKLNQ